MTDVELSALVALKNGETALLNAHVAQYGAQQMATDATLHYAIVAELTLRGVLPHAS